MILLIGASASGKTEVAKELGKTFQIKKVVTTTTRAMRPLEQDGVDYFFITKEEFLDRKNKELFVETTFYNDNYYGCGKDQIGENKVVVVDPNGLKAFKALNDPSIVTFYLTASEETRLKRMEERGDPADKAIKRIKVDRFEFVYDKVGNTDFIIDTEKSSVANIAKDVYTKYIQKLVERNINN